MSGMKKLKVDFEFTSKMWWTSGGEDLWNGISEAFDGSEIRKKNKPAFKNFCTRLSQFRKLNFSFYFTAPLPQKKMPYTLTFTTW